MNGLWYIVIAWACVMSALTFWLVKVEPVVRDLDDLLAQIRSERRST